MVKKVAVDWRRDQLLNGMDRAEEDRLTAHVFTELVGLQMLLMARFSVDAGTVPGACSHDAVRQGKAAMELLAQGLGQEEI